MKKIEEKKLKTAQEYGNVNATDGDLVEVNAGGSIIAAKRSTLTQLVGTRLEALFSGRWDKKLQRDGSGRIFLDVNPVCFRAIVDHLNEKAISSEDDLPSPPSVGDEDNYILRRQLELFDLCSPKMLDSAILGEHRNLVHGWLEEDGLDGEWNLLYRSSRDGLSAANFHSKCDNQGCTLTVIETTDGFVLGGYSNTPWTNDDGIYKAANKAFLFVLSGNDVTRPCKMTLKNANGGCAVYHESRYGPTFGSGFDLYVHGSDGHINLNLGHTYDSVLPGRLTTRTNGCYARLAIKELEVFEVAGEPSPVVIAPKASNEHLLQPIEPVTSFSKIVNEAINAKKESLMKAEAEILQLEESLDDEQKFIETIASGDPKDVVTLNVSGTIMATKRSTLCSAEESVLAQQFDDTKWTEQGCNASRVDEWTPHEVSDWVRNIPTLKEDVGSLLKESEITGSELLAMNMEGLKMIGVERAGTLCLMLKEIEKLEKASRDVVTLVEHSPYCFSKILDHLRLSQLNANGFGEEPALPRVCESQKSRFEKVVKYYFPGDTSKFVLG
ncbi:hypothetical protein ACHAWF_014432 [Thalassiosira exigua]